MLDLLREFAAAAGVEDPLVQRGRTPDGRDFLGVRCPGGYEVRQALWDRLREQHPRTGFWPLVSHEGPEEWEWSPDPHPVVESPAGSGTLDRIVAAHGPDVAGFLAGSPEDGRFEGLEALVGRVRAATAAQEPYVRGALIRRIFAFPPEWVCVVAVGPSVHDLPQVLHAPDALSWPGPAAFPTLTYADHSAGRCGQGQGLRGQRTHWRDWQDWGVDFLHQCLSWPKRGGSRCSRRCSMIDLSDTVRQVLAGSLNRRSQNDVLPVAHSIVNGGDYIFDWDRDADEEWLSVLGEDGRVAMVSARFSLTFCLDSIEFGDVVAVSEAESLIKVPSFSEDILSCDLSILGEAFGGGECSMG